MPDLTTTLAALESLAPSHLAAAWDNTGLLLEGDREIERALLTIDLSEAVVAEAREADVDLIIAYHPPIFRGLKTITRSTARGRGLLDLARAGVHLYSPHTALDAVVGGVNDWLLEAFGEVHTVCPIDPDREDPRAGVGRTAHLCEPRRLGQLAAAVKQFLDLPAVRVSGDPDHPIRTVAVCPGAGGSAFEGIGQIDLLVTGEMRHHDVLGFAEAGTSVILTDHTHTERGFLPRYAERIAHALGIEVRVSTRDADPLRFA